MSLLASFSNSSMSEDLPTSHTIANIETSETGGADDDVEDDEEIAELERRGASSPNNLSRSKYLKTYRCKFIMIFE